DDYRNNFVIKACVDEELSLDNCEKYCLCKYHCPNETEQVNLLTPILKAPELIEIFVKNFGGKGQLATYKDEFVKLIAFNFANAREKTAMAQIYQ
ncbi:unnamed protein product, partial [Rotaria magnacalcarata]